MPAGEPGTAPLVVTAGGVPSNSVDFSYNAPSITGVTPDTGPAGGGNQVTITGTSFGAATGTVTVNGNTATVSSWTDTSVTATVPAGTGARLRSC